MYFLEIGFAPEYQSLNIISEESNFTRNENVYYVDFDAEVLILNYFFIGGSAKTFIQPNNKKRDFYPIQMDYLFRTGLRYKNIEIGFNHFCTHPVQSVGIISRGTAYGGYEEFYIRIEKRM